MTQKKNILFRVSGGRAFNKELGLGHVYRAINLALELKPNNIFFLVEDYGNVKSLLLNWGFKNIFLLKGGIKISSDITETTKLLYKKKIDILIVDKYDYNTKKYVKRMHKIVKTVVVPDLEKIDYDADLVVNGFIGFDNTILTNRYGAKCLLGPKYQILNKKYRNRKFANQKKYTILATFGGFDEHDIVPVFCKQLTKYLDRITAKIILGPATKKSKELKNLEKKFRGKIKIISATKNIKKEISNAEFGICGGGITTYEFASMGVPFAIICQYKHQLKTARAWKRKKIALNFGFANHMIDSKIQCFLSNITNNKIQLKSKSTIVDGLGTKRIRLQLDKM